jgi:hypothetical protein
MGLWAYKGLYFTIICILPVSKINPIFVDYYALCTLLKFQYGSFFKGLFFFPTPSTRNIQHKNHTYFFLDRN